MTEKEEHFLIAKKAKKIERKESQRERRMRRNRKREVYREDTEKY